MAAVDGLITGLDTATIIKQLMDIERLPQTRLKDDQAYTNRIAGAYRALNTQFLAVKTSAEALVTGKAWDASKATSSDATRVTATATAGTAAGSLSFTVDQLAVAGVSASSGTAAGATAADAAATVPATTVRLTKGATSTDIATGDGSLAALVKNINDAKAGVTATAVQTTAGQWKLHLASTTTGADSGISLDDGTDGGNPFSAAALGTVAPVTAGKDALLTVGGTSGYTISRPSNTIDDLLTGVTLKLVRPDAAVPVTVDTAQDTAAVAESFGKLIDTVNKALDEMKKYTAFNKETAQASLLTGDGLVRGLQRSLVDAVGNGNAKMGLSVSREGTITFDKARFAAAHDADPAAVRHALSGKPSQAGPPPVAAVPGVAERLLKAGDNASRAETAAGGPGRITSAIKSREDTARGYSSQISTWDSRLALRETGLRKKYAGLEVALGKMQQQGSWLAGQLASLPTRGDL